MDKDFLFRLLQVTVVAPYLYSVSEDENLYFKIGLKMLAAGIVLRNVKPIMQDLAPIINAASEMHKKGIAMSKIQKENAIDAEVETIA